MKRIISLFLGAFTVLTTGCATVTPPPERIHWDEVATSTQCTDEASGASAQYTGSLIAAGLGGWNIGAGIALGTFPIVGIPLAAVGIYGSADAGTKFQQINQCKEFKQYVLLRQPKKQVATGIEAKLNELDLLLKKGAISEDEYKIARKDVLGGI